MFSQTPKSIQIELLKDQLKTLESENRDLKATNYFLKHKLEMDLYYTIEGKLDTAAHNYLLPISGSRLMKGNELFEYLKMAYNAFEFDDLTIFKAQVVEAKPQHGNPWDEFNNEKTMNKTIERGV